MVNFTLNNMRGPAEVGIGVAPARASFGFVVFHLYTSHISAATTSIIIQTPLIVIFNFITNNKNCNCFVFTLS